MKRSFCYGIAQEQRDVILRLAGEAQQPRQASGAALPGGILGFADVNVHFGIWKH